MTVIRRNPDTLARLAQASLASLRQAAARDLVTRLEAVLANLTRDYPAQEIASWSRKIEAARTVWAGGADPLIMVEAEARGMSATMLAGLVLTKGSAFEIIVARVSAIRAAAHTAIQAATAEAEIAAIIASAETQATAAIADQGDPA